MKWIVLIVEGNIKTEGDFDEDYWKEGGEDTIVVLSIVLTMGVRNVCIDV